MPVSITATLMPVPVFPKLPHACNVPISGTLEWLSSSTSGITCTAATPGREASASIVPGAAWTAMPL